MVGKPPIDGLVWCLRDLTERRRWEVATNDIERFRSLVHNSASILLLLDRAGTVQSVSAAITRMLGHDQALVEGHPLEDLVVQADRPGLGEALAAALDREQAEEGPTIVEVDLRRRDGGVPVPCELSIVNLLDDPTVNGLVVSAHNITQLRSTRTRERLATRDPLTGLPNRKLILDRIEQMQKRGRRRHEGAVLFVDLDRFKDVNDSLGHRVGDDVLRQAAIRFQGALREEDSIGRLGGDEFVVLVEGFGSHHAEAATGVPRIAHRPVRGAQHGPAPAHHRGEHWHRVRRIRLGRGPAHGRGRRPLRGQGGRGETGRCASSRTCGASSGPGSSSNATCAWHWKAGSSSSSTNRSSS